MAVTKCNCWHLATPYFEDSVNDVHQATKWCDFGYPTKSGALNNTKMGKLLLFCSLILIRAAVLPRRSKTNLKLRLLARLKKQTPTNQLRRAAATATAGDDLYFQACVKEFFLCCVKACPDECR